MPQPTATATPISLDTQRLKQNILLSQNVLQYTGGNR
jgi:hypothetical protein